MEEDREDEEGDHQDERADCCGDGEETDWTELGEVDACEELLGSPRVYQAFGVDLRFGYEEDVVFVGNIEERHSQRGKPQN